MRERVEEQLKQVGAIYVGTARVEVDVVEDCRKMMVQINQKHPPPLMLVLATVIDDKAYITAMVSPELGPAHSAQQLIQTIAPHIEGKGGGSQHFALASGARLEGVDKALAEAAKYMEQTVGV